MDNEPPMQVYRPDPCPECPWRRNHPAGWLGGLDIEWFTGRARAQTQIACHKTCGGTGEPKLCTGYAQHLNNSCSRPRDVAFAEVIDTLGTNPEVFSWTSEFDAHHRSVPEYEAQRIHKGDMRGDEQ